MVYVYLAEGFEETEAITVVDVLRRGNIEVKLVSTEDKLQVMGAHGILVTADIFYEEAEYDNCKMIVLPGGLPGATNLRANEDLCHKIVEFEKEGKYICAICAAPFIFAELGLLKGKKATVYPGFAGDLGGAKIKNKSVCVDNNIVTAKGPVAAMDFGLTLLELLRGVDLAEKIASDMLTRY